MPLGNVQLALMHLGQPGSLCLQFLRPKINRRPVDQIAHQRRCACLKHNIMDFTGFTHEQHARAGTVRMLAVAARERVGDFKDVPTLRELGVGDVSVSKKMRKLGEALYGRMAVYEPALRADDAATLAALAPTVTTFVVLYPILGLGAILMVATSNSYLQVSTDDEFRGRVMAIYLAVFFGTTPVGAPAVGWLAEEFGARTSLWLPGLLGLVATAVVAGWWRRRPCLDQDAPCAPALAAA